MDTIAPGEPDGSSVIVPDTDPVSRWSRLPADMRARPQWVLAPPGDKRPRTSDGGPASSTAPSTWTNFTTACAAAVERGWDIGYVLAEGDRFTCIDLDVKEDTPVEQLERHDIIVATLASYTERSRSGRGKHVWVRAEVGRGCRRDNVEVYDRERYIICTGDVVHDLPVEDRQDLISRLVAEMSPRDLAPAIELTGEDRPNEAVAVRARADQGRLGQLWRGGWRELGFSSQSDGDLALVKLLVPLSMSARECWATFRLSELGKREKAARPDYMSGTIAVAVKHVLQDAEALRHGREVSERLLRNLQSSPPPSRLRLLFDGDLDAQPSLRWLVKGIVPNAGIGAIYGASGTYKSFLTLDLLAHISNGWPWFGHRVKAAQAVYLPFEGQGGIRNRIRAWRIAKTRQRNPGGLFVGEPDEDVRSHVAVIMEPLNLREQADRDELVTTLKQAGYADGVLCIDTLAQAANGIDENSSAMGEMLTAFRDLQQRLGGVILLVHHSGKDDKRGMRGWSGMHAAMDFVIECQQTGEPAAREATFNLAKVKDGTTGTTFGFRMELVHLGLDEDGDTITSLTVCPAEPGQGVGPPFVEDALREAEEDDAFVAAWVRELMTQNVQPTGRWLEAARPNVKDRRKLTQKRLRDAIVRLRASGRLADERDSAGMKWLRAIDVPQVPA